MNNTTNNQQLCDVVCKRNCRLQSHERDLHRVCPSKLSKRELENLYFAVLENNLELKKTLHSQHDKIKVLSTKLQRMTVVQRQLAGKEKDCCSSKVLVKEQKEIIEDLKNANEQMADRVRHLNMQLCSAKQFLRRSPAQTRCPRCGVCPAFGGKNSSMSAIGAKPSQASVKTTAASYQYIPVDASEGPKITTQEVATETDQYVNEGMEKQCNENKCRSVMDELKQKIVDLQEELSKTHDDYSKRISRLENDVSGLHQENLKVRSSKAASDHALEQKQRKTDDLTGKLRETEGKANDLKMQLSIEKRKVKELETTLKLAKTSSQAATLMEKINTLEPTLPAATEVSGSVSSYYSVKQDYSPHNLAPSPQCLCKPDMLSPTSATIKEAGKFPKSDDSGCTDLNKSSDAEDSRASYMERLNKEMLKKISDLQLQVDGFRIKAAGESAKLENRAPSDIDYYDNETQMTVITITDPIVVVEIQELDQKRQDSNTEKDIDTSTSTPIKNSELPSTSNKTGSVEVTSRFDTDLEETPNKPLDLGRTIKRTSSSEKRTGESKRDDDNRYQIPGPISPTFRSYGDKKKRLKNSKSKKDKSNDETDEEKGLQINKPLIDDVSNKLASVKAKSDLKTDADTSIKQNGTPIKTVESPKARSQKLIFDPKKSLITGPKTTDPKATPDTGTKIIAPKAESVTESKIADPKTTYVTGPNIVDPKSAQLTGPKIEDTKNKLVTAIKIVDPKETTSAEMSIVDQNKDQVIDDDDLTAVLGNFQRDSTPKTPTIPTSSTKGNELKLNTDKFQTKTKTSVEEFTEIKKESTSSDIRIINAQKISQAVETESGKENIASIQTDQTADKSVSGRMVQLGEVAQCPSSTAKTVPLPTAPETPPPKTISMSTVLPAESKKELQTEHSTPPLAVQTIEASAPPTVPQTVQSSAPRRDSATYTGTPVRRDSATYTAMPPRRDSATYTAMPPRQDSATYTALPPRRDSGTFTMPEPEKCKCERATSPANTDRDVSSLSDLPPEKYNGSPRGTPLESPRDAYSPGEERRASTYTETDSRTNDYGPLSDGEIPTHATLARHRILSFGEQPTYARSAPRSPEVQMEATLNAISEELAHCRKLLAAAREHEVRHWDRTS